MCILLLAAGAFASAGCIQRRITITSEPPGALVHLNDLEVGYTPVEVDFTYFGDYDVRLSKPGYEPLLTHAKAKAPVYEWPGIDLVAEALPVTFHTDVRWHFTLYPEERDVDALIERAKDLQGAAQAAEEREQESPAPPPSPDAPR